jgi:hypothetical protein
LPKQGGKDDHHAALPYSDVPGFVETLSQTGVSEGARLAFEFLILTASRTNEVLGMMWQEVDDVGRTWTVPAERMKAKRIHRVPLSPRCVEILDRAKQIGAQSAFVFPGRPGDKPLSARTTPLFRGESAYVRKSSRVASNLRSASPCKCANGRRPMTRAASIWPCAITNPLEAVRRNMEEKAADELVGAQRHRLLLGAMAIIRRERNLGIRIGERFLLGLGRANQAACAF